MVEQYWNFSKTRFAQILLSFYLFIDSLSENLYELIHRGEMI